MRCSSALGNYFDDEAAPVRSGAWTAGIDDEPNRWMLA
jgi:hypothetical protein